MDSCHQEKDSEVDCSSALTDCATTVRTLFSPTQQRLESTLEMSQSLATVIAGDNSLARHFGVPLASDSMARKIEPLFGKIQLMKDNEGKVDDTICWLDIVLAPLYKPVLREDGYYYLQLDGRSGLIRVSESNHNFIESGLPQKLIDPCSYPSDLQSEEGMMLLVEGLLLNLDNLASQIIDLNNGCRARISQRLGTLRQLSGGYSQNTREIHDKSNHVDLQTTEPPEPATSKGVRKRKPPSTMLPWEPEELDRLPQWFQDHKHLTKEQVEAKFKKDFGRFRTFGAIVTAQYRARNKHGTRRVGLKRKLHPDDSLPPSTAIGPARVEIPDRIDPVSPASNSGPRPSISFLAPLRSLCSPGTSKGGTTEKQCTDPSHQVPNIETVTLRDTAERPLRNDCSSLGTSTAEVENSDPTGTAVLNPEQITRDGRSSGGHPSTQPCSTDNREANNPDADAQCVYEADSIASTQLAKPHYELNSGGLDAHAIAPESPGARLLAHESRANHNATANTPLGVNTVSSTENDCEATGARPEGRGIQPKSRDDPGQTILLPTHHPKESSTPQSQRNHHLKDTLHQGSPIDSLEHVVEVYTAVDHRGLSGQEQSVSAAHEGSPWMPSNGSRVNPSSPSSVSGQGLPGGRGVLTAANRLPLPIYPDTGPQAMPPIDQVLNGQFMPSNQPAFSGWSQQP